MIAQYNFELNKNMIYLIETLKVEGYWSLKSFTLSIQNKDVPLLNHIEEIAKNLGLNVSKRLLLKIRLKDKSKKEDVELHRGNKKINFHIEKSPFDNNKVKAVTSLPFNKSYQIKLKNKNKKYQIKIKCLKKENVVDSNVGCWVYKDIRFPTKKLLTFLDEYCKGNKNLHVEKFLFNANKEIVMSAFSALMDCEGSLDHYKLTRRLRVRMKNKEYLRQWSNLLKKFGIHSHFRRNHENEWEINISGWEDFNRLENLGFKLYHSKKSEKWRTIMESFKRNQISRNSYKDFYINKLKELNKKVTAKEFADYLNKSKRVVNYYLLKLEKQKLISCNRNSWPYLYFITTSSVR